MLLVGLARSGDRGAFAELVNRRQIWIRNLMRRCCGDVTLADDLAQQVFLKAWQKIPSLQQPRRFAGWLKRLAINEWLQYVRKNDPLRQAEKESDKSEPRTGSTSLVLDLDRALATLPDDVRLCIVLSYHEGMTHDEVAEFTRIPLGTVKSHIRRGSKRLQEELAAYGDTPSVEEAS